MTPLKPRLKPNAKPFKMKSTSALSGCPNRSLANLGIFTKLFSIKYGNGLITGLISGCRWKEGGCCVFVTVFPWVWESTPVAQVRVYAGWSTVARSLVVVGVARFRLSSVVLLWSWSRLRGSNGSRLMVKRGLKLVERLKGLKGLGWLGWWWWRRWHWWSLRLKPRLIRLLVLLLSLPVT